jgi:hypothetical protein
MSVKEITETYDVTEEEIKPPSASRFKASIRSRRRDEDSVR